MTEMGEQTLEPADNRPGRGLGAVAGVLGLVAALTVGAIALDSGTPAAAEGLEQFDSCAELQTYTEELQQPIDDVEQAGGGDMAVEESGRDDAATSSAGSGAAEAPAPASASPTTVADALEASGDGDTGGTNTVVEGVDEIDVIDRVAPNRLLVARQGAIALVDLDGLSIVSEVRGVPYDARVSASDGVIFAAGSSNDGMGTEVRRILIDGDALVEDGAWTTPGYLLDARRTGDRLHVVAVDHGEQPGVVPFEDGPVPCDQIWRPVAPATTPAATLVATLPASGALEPTAATAVTGSGGTMLVTGSAVYVATLAYDEDGSATTGLHRFDLETLAPTGSGAVPGTVAGPFALNEHAGNLRVATSDDGGFGIGGRPIPIEGDAGFGAEEPAVDVAEESAGATGEATETTTTPAPSEPAEDPPVTIEPFPAPTDTTAPDTTVPETTEPETTEPQITEPQTTEPEPIPTDGAALAEVFVLDTDGDLDVIGSTGRFGRDYETIQGVRFVGDLAYVVTFLQTDPFWVIDLTDPTAPTVVGELQIPGFSGYLHPIGDDLVVGFGPDGNGSAAARLFDVSDPTAPQVVDELRLGDDTPVQWDHHAFVGIDEDSFAVPVTDYPDYVGGNCEVIGEPVPLPEPIPVDPGIGDGTSGSAPGSAGVDAPNTVCEEPTPVGGATGAVVIDVEDDHLSVAEDVRTDRADVYAERVVQRPNGAWLLLSYDRLVDLRDGSELVLPFA